MLLIHHADFQSGGAPEDLLGLGSVLHARQLHHHAVDALLLDDRLGHPQFVDAVAQRGDVLLQREILDALLRLQVQARHHGELAALLPFLQQQVRKGLLQLRHALPALRLIAKPDYNRLTLAGNAGVMDLLFPQQPADVSGIALHGLVQRRFHVHLQQEVHPAAQIQAEVHRQRPDMGQPGRRARQQVERGNIAVPQLGLQQILGFQLGVGIGETDLDAGLIEEDSSIGYLLLLQNAFHLLQQVLVNLEGGLDRGNLHRRHLTEKVGQGVEQAEQQRHSNDEVLPQRITVHERLKAMRAAPRKLANSLDRPFGQQRLHRVLLHVDHHIVGNLHTDVVLAHPDDFAQHAAPGDHLGPLLQRSQHVFLLLGALHLGPDDYEEKQRRTPPAIKAWATPRLKSSRPPRPVSQAFRQTRRIPRRQTIWRSVDESSSCTPPSGFSKTRYPESVPSRYSPWPMKCRMSSGAPAASRVRCSSSGVASSNRSTSARPASSRRRNPLRMTSASSSTESLPSPNGWATTTRMRMAPPRVGIRSAGTAVRTLRVKFTSSRARNVLRSGDRKSTRL